MSIDLSSLDISCMCVDARGDFIFALRSSVRVLSKKGDIYYV